MDPMCAPRPEKRISFGFGDGAGPARPIFKPCRTLGKRRLGWPFLGCLPSFAPQMHHSVVPLGAVSWGSLCRILGVFRLSISLPIGFTSDLLSSVRPQIAVAT